MVGIINETLIDFAAICDVKVAMPTMNDLPQGFEGFGRASPHGQAPLGHHPTPMQEYLVQSGLPQSTARFCFF